MSTGAIRAYARQPRRKCSFRFLFVDAAGNMCVVTQDARRRRRPVTGRVHLHGYKSLTYQHVAHIQGCSVIVRVKNHQQKGD